MYFLGITSLSSVDFGSVLSAFMSPSVDVIVHYLGLNDAFFLDFHRAEAVSG